MRGSCHSIRRSIAALTLLLIPQVHALTTAATMVGEFDPLSCGRAALEVAATDMCKNDLGAFQVARLALSVEMLASAYRSAGVSASSADIQTELLRDVVKFSATLALTRPAMALSDLAGVSHSPFGAAAPAVQAKALLATDYLQPGFLERAGMDRSALLGAAGVQVLPGARDFGDFLSKFAGSSAGLDAYRLTSVPDGVPSVLFKRSFPNESFPKGVSKNSAADFVVPAGFTGANSNVAPFGEAFVTLAGQARLQGVKLGGTPQPQGQALYQLPFGGATCPICSSNVQAPSSQAFAAGVPLDLARSAFASPFTPASSVKNGFGIIQSERSARLDMFQDGKTAAASKSAVGQAAPSTSGDTTAGTKASEKKYVWGPTCSESCINSENTKATVGAFGDIVGVGRAIWNGDGDKVVENWEKLEGRIQQKWTAETTCKEKCPEEEPKEASPGTKPDKGGGQDPKDDGKPGQGTGTPPKTTSGDSGAKATAGMTTTPDSADPPKQGQGEPPKIGPSDCQPNTYCTCDVTAGGLIRGCRAGDLTAGASKGDAPFSLYFDGKSNTSQFYIRGAEGSTISTPGGQPGPASYVPWSYSGSYPPSSFSDKPKWP